MRSMAKYFALTAAVLLVGAGTVTRGQTGTCVFAGCLDVSFGDGGTASSSLLPGTLIQLARQPLGGQDLIVAIGRDGSSSSWILAPFLPGGTLDTSFGTNGTVKRTYKKGYAIASEIALQPDGKILVLGTLPLGPVISGTPSPKLALTRYWPDGLGPDGTGYDRTFGTDGTVTIDPPAGARPFRQGDYALALQADSKILVAAATPADSDPYTAPFADLHVVRLDSAGRFDTTFGSNPQNAFASFPDGGMPNSMIVQQMGTSEAGFEERAVVAARKTICYSPCQPYYVAHVRRLTTDGLPDATFGDAGVAEMDIPGASGTDFDGGLVVDSANRIVAAGSFFFDLPSGPFPSRMLMARYLEDGSLDTSFGILGVLRQDWLDNRFIAVAVQSDGRILATAYWPDKIWRFLPDGGLDPQFGLGGVGTPNPPDRTFLDGRIVLTRTPGDANALVVGGRRCVPSGRKNPTETCTWALWRYFY